MSVDLERVFEIAAEPTIWLARKPQLKTLSRLGGLPSLGVSQEWPRHLSLGNPLHFLAQVDLGELPPTPLKFGGPKLPRAGVLMVFADMDSEMLWDKECTRVVYAETPGPDRSSPVELPLVQHDQGQMRGPHAYDIAVFPKRPIKAHVIDFGSCK